MARGLGGDIGDALKTICNLLMMNDNCSFIFVYAWHKIEE